MANWIAITWENDRLMLLSAAVHNAAPTFEQAACFALNASKTSPLTDFAEEGETTRAKNPSLKKQLADFVQQHRLQRSEVVVVLSRADVEVRPMLFPPVPIEELPDLVKFQASKEFNGYDGAAPLDFFITNKLENVSRSTLFPALDSSGLASSRKVSKGEAQVPSGAPKHLLASTLRTATFRKIQEFCEELNLTLRRAVLRPSETAYLFRQMPGFDPGRSVLLVELDQHETSQAVLFQGEPVFMRSPKIGCPDDVSTSDFAARLVAELKRTRIAVRNEIQGVTIDEVVLCGKGRRFESLAAQVAEAMEIPVKTFDPWNGYTRGGELRGSKLDPDAGLPEKPERYAPLIGSLLQVARGEPGTIDFCNPKKRPEPAGHRQLITGALAAALVLLTCLIGYGFWTRMTLIDEVKKLSNQRTALQRTAAIVAEQQTQLAAIDAWSADDVNWFEQLEWLSRKAPGSQDMILTELTLLADKGGSMKLKSLLKDASVVGPMEERLRDENHVIKTGEKRESKSNTISPIYGFRYDLDVFLSSESLDADLAQPEPAEVPPVENGAAKPKEAEPEGKPQAESETESEGSPPMEEPKGNESKEDRS